MADPKIVMPYSRWLLDTVLMSPLIRFSVPCFIMISGRLLLDPDRYVPLDKIKHYLKKYGLILFIFGMAYCLIERVFDDGLHNIVQLIIASFLDFLQGHSWNHMWYLYMMIGLYVMTPILRSFIIHSDNKTIFFVWWSLFICTEVIPTLNEITGYSFTTFDLSGMQYIFIYLTGYIVGFMNRRWINIGGILGIAGYMVMSFFSLPVSQLNLFMVLEAMMIMRLFSDGKIRIRPNRFITEISKYSLLIYLIHPFWLNLANKGFHIYPNVLPILIGELVFFALVLVLSVCSSYLISKIVRIISSM